MALFKILKGQATNLANQAKKEGYAWFTTDEGKLYIDTSDTERITLNADKADYLKIDENTALSANNFLNYADNQVIVEYVNFISDASLTIACDKNLDNYIINIELNEEGHYSIYELFTLRQRYMSANIEGHIFGDNVLEITGDTQTDPIPLIITCIKI